MYYEERIINNILMCRAQPDEDWEPVDTCKGRVVNEMLRLTGNQRVEVMNYFCLHCGTVQKPNKWCQCWNDE